LLDGWAKVEEVLFWEVFEQWRLVVLNRRSPPNQVGGTPDRPGVSLVLLECGGMPKVYSWMRELSEGERYMEGRQIDWDVISKGEGDFFTWKDIDLAVNKRAMRELMNGVIKSDTTFDFARPHRRRQKVDPWCKGCVWTCLEATDPRKVSRRRDVMGNWALFLDVRKVVGQGVRGQ